MFSRTIAAFDFDGTLTTKDTLLEFIRFACGRTRFYAGFLLFAPLIVLMKMGMINNGRVKERVFSWFFKGMSYADFSEKGRVFARLIAGFERKEIKTKLQTHLAEGHDVYVVTASIEEWVRPYCMQLGVKDVLGTKVEVADGVLTGRFASPNCYGKEKANRLLEAVPDLSSCTLYAYGDSRGDREMLQMSCNQQKSKQSHATLFIILFFLSLPVILLGLIQILPTFDDWTYITTPYFGDLFAADRMLPWNGYWRPFDALIGSILGLNYNLFPALNHSLILLAHALSTCLVYKLSGKKILPAAFFFLSPAMLGTVLDIDSVNQAYATCWGLLSLLFYRQGKKLQWILCVMIATFCKENGIMYTFIPFLFSFLPLWRSSCSGKHLCELSGRGSRWVGGGLAFLTLYGTARILLTSPDNQIQDVYLTTTLLDHLKDIVQYLVFTWLPMDYKAVFFPPTRCLPLALVTFLMSLPFLFLLAKGLWISRRDKILWALIAAYFLAAAPHLLTLVSMMHIYAGLPFAALIIGRLQSRYFRVLPIILFFAASLVTDVHHYHAAYQSGLMGKEMAEQVLSQTKTKSERVFVVTIDRGELKYSIFNVIPSDAFGWGLAARHYSGYTVASELRDTTIAAPATPAEKQQTVQRIAEEVRPHYPYDAFWVVDGKEVTVINPPAAKPY